MTFRPAVVIACAMEEELAPFLAHAKQVEPALAPLGANDHQRFYTAQVEGLPVVLAQSGIGLVNAAVATTRVLARFTPQIYLLAGTTGGLAGHVEVGDVVAGTSAAFLDANATIFGYALGQTPRMPPKYDADTLGVPLATRPDLHGPVLSGNSFVTAQTVGATRERFPEALAVDMETAAAAQVCYMYNQSWLSLRAVSDLCGPRADQEFHIEVEAASALSFEGARALLRSLSG